MLEEAESIMDADCRNSLGGRGICLLASLPDHRPISQMRHLFFIESLYSSFSFCDREKHLLLSDIFGCSFCNKLEALVTGFKNVWIKPTLKQESFWSKVVPKRKEDSFWSKSEKQEGGGAITLWINDRGAKFSALLYFSNPGTKDLQQKVLRLQFMLQEPATRSYGLLDFISTSAFDIQPLTAFDSPTVTSERVGLVREP